MSDTGAKSSQPLAVKQEKDVTPKRGRGRPRKQTQEPTGAPTPKRSRGRPRGSKNKVSPSKSGSKSGGAEEGTKPRGRPKKLKAETTGTKKPRGRPRKRKDVPLTAAAQMQRWAPQRWRTQLQDHGNADDCHIYLWETKIPEKFTKEDTALDIFFLRQIKSLLTAAKMIQKGNQRKTHTAMRPQND
ncbi:uncharacterized protein [Mobula birostris]|uniref:uncharacterized protein isoform X1 n=1 Tax=Mobula birostris TaxID=1983395 RepID=UPI003B289507